MSDDILDPEGRHAAIDAGWQIGEAKLEEKPEEKTEATVEVPAQSLYELAEVVTKATERAEEEERAEAIEAAFDLIDEQVYDEDVPASFAVANLAETHGLDVAERWVQENEDLDGLTMLAHLKAEAAAEIQAKQAEHEAAQAQEIAKLGRATMANVPEHLRATVTELVARSGAMASTPEEARAILEQSVRGAQELERAKQEAKIDALAFGDDDFLRDGWLGGDNSDGRVSLDEYRGDAYLKSLGRAIDPARALPKKPFNSDEEIIGIVDDWKAREKMLDDGWNI